MKGPFAFVRYTLDSKTKTVPVSHIKDFKPKEYYAGMTASVFWSPNEEESIEDFMLLHGQILDVEDIREVNSKDNDGPLGGWYKAQIIRVADTEEELSKKRNAAPTHKSVALQENKKEKQDRKGPKNAKDVNSGDYISKGREKRLEKKSDIRTVAYLEENFGKEKKASKKKKKRRKQRNDDSSCTSESDSDESIMQTGKYTKVKRELAAMTEKCKILQKELNETKLINLQWQEKFFDLSSGQHVQSSKQKYYESKSQMENDCIETAVTSPGKKVKKRIEFAAVSDFLEEQSAIKESQMTPITVSCSDVSCPSPDQKSAVPKFESRDGSGTETIVVVSPAKSSSAWKVSPCKVNAVAPSTPVKSSHSKDVESSSPISQETATASKSGENSSDSKLQIPLTPRKLSKVMINVRHAEYGDSLFVKNLAHDIFGPTLLVRSTVRGKKIRLDTGKTSSS